MRDLCDKIKALSTLFVFGLGLTVLAATPTVTSVTAQQRYPWNGLVDIAVTINGTESEVAKAECTFVASDSATEQSLTIAHVTQVGGDSGSGSSWTRRFIWDTNADVGEVRILDVELVVEVDTSDAVQLWEGGPYWAKCNVGASKPEEYGSYFSYDAAATHLGASWRMPTAAEFSALINNCGSVWTTRNGVFGRLVKGRGAFSNKSIFLPAAGAYVYDSGSYGTRLYGTGTYGYYWSSTPHSSYSERAWFLYFLSSMLTRGYGNRGDRRSVRPLREFAQTTSSSVSCHFALDNRIGVRTAKTTERIRFSPVWATDAAGAIATVSVNGVAVESATASGAYGWTPTQAGTYQFTHTVRVNGVQVGETLTATFVVSGMSPISADWSVGSITLKATGVTVEDGESVWLSYCDANAENGNWDYVDSFTKTVDDAEKSICVTDTGFSSRLGGIPPVKYRLQIGKNADDARVTLYCTTRTRYGLFVGYSMYNRDLSGKTWATPLPQSLADATELRQLCVGEGGFLPDNAKLLANSSATTYGISAAIDDFANHTTPGDLFVFYIATHGGDYGAKKARLCAYDYYYYVDSLQEDVRKFSSGVAIVGVVMACHSQSMTGVASTNETVNAWLSNCGFGQCLGNVAWIVSCASSESSYNSRDFSLFGESFIRDGLRDGYADARLYGVEYGGGNSDGNITMGELGRYAGAFAVGISDNDLSTVQLENDGLLDRIVIRDGVTYTHLNRPDPPANVTASQGSFDYKIQVGWNGSATATSYRIYRYPAESQSGTWAGRSFSDLYDDTEVDVGKQYAYRIRAVNPIGLSELSSAYSGSRGSESFFAFLKRRFGGSPDSISSAEYAAIEKSIAANGCRTVGECYALGIDPEDPNDDFKIEKFEMKDGTPVITLSHTTDGAGNTFESRIKTLGKENLSDADWVDLTDKDQSAYRFFKVTVEMP